MSADRFDKEGDPEFGKKDPGRCVVCLAWVRYPYHEGSQSTCPSCHDMPQGQRNEKRREVKNALQDVWRDSSSNTGQQEEIA